MDHPITIGISAVNLIVLLGVYRKMSIIVYQHGLMWAEFANKKGLDPNGKASAAGAD
jgi:hypothetical protein